MKRTTTEIFIEVEETVCMRLKEKSADDSKGSGALQPTCPLCGQEIQKSKKLKEEKLK